MTQRPRLLDEATANENHDRFVRRVAEHESVWTLNGDTGPVLVESNRELEPGQNEPRVVYMVFSDRAYAERALKESWPDSELGVREIDLFDFLFRWLTGMGRDGHLVGTNWTGDLIGVEVEPRELQEQLLAALGPEQAPRYFDRARAEASGEPRESEREAWLRENEAAISDYNESVRRGVFSDDWRDE